VYLPYVIAIGVRGRAGFFRRGASVLNAPVLRQPLQRNVESLVLFGSTIECAPRSISGMKACNPKEPVHNQRLIAGCGRAGGCAKAKLRRFSAQRDHYSAAASVSTAASGAGGC
jgi:hypothetical protein